MLEEDGTLTVELEDDPLEEEPCPLLVSGTLDVLEDISELSVLLVSLDMPISEEDPAELPETVLLC